MKLGNDDVVYSNFLVVQAYILVYKRLELVNIYSNFSSMIYINNTDNVIAKVKKYLNTVENTFA